MSEWPRTWVVKANTDGKKERKKKKKKKKTTEGMDKLDKSTLNITK